MTKTKQFYTVFFAICLLVPALFLFTACAGNNGPTSDRMMTMSINPEVTFVVDKDNKISSISFGNEDAGDIYANVNFENLDVKEAIKLFLENATISGHIGLSSGTANEVAIKVSGSVEKDITALEDLAKKQVKSVFEGLGIEATVNIAEITDAQMKSGLVTTALGLYPEKTTTELEALTNDELIALINAKQEEYKNLTYSKMQELKNEINTQLESASSQLGVLKATIDSAKTSLNQAKAALQQAGTNASTLLQEAVTAAENALNEAEEAYEEAINNLRTAKEQTIATEKANLLNEFKNLVQSSETNLVNHLDQAKADGKITQAQYDYWKNLIDTNKPATN